MEFIISFGLAATMLLAISLQRTYGALPIKELKRRARAKDPTAMLLHQAVAYGVSLRVLLWFIVGLSTAGFFVFTSLHLPSWVAFGLGCLLIWVGFSRLNSRNVRQLSLWFAKYMAPILGRILEYLHAPITWVVRRTDGFRQVHVHTGLYEKEDLIDLLSKQQKQADNRIEKYEIELAKNALTFGSVPVSEVLTPRRMVKQVSVEDNVGPMLMDDLHKSGFSRIPVYEGKKDNFVGTLFLKDLVMNKSANKIKDVMRREVCYVHEEQTLYDALQTILKSKFHLLIVVNSFEEYVGVLSIEDVLERIVGENIVDEFDEHDDLRAVAARFAKKEHETHEEVATTVETDEKVVK